MIACSLEILSNNETLDTPCPSENNGNNGALLGLGLNEAFAHYERGDMLAYATDRSPSISLLIKRPG
jgi:hypothetical protein